MQVYRLDGKGRCEKSVKYEIRWTSVLFIDRILDLHLCQFRRERAGHGSGYGAARAMKLSCLSY